MNKPDDKSAVKEDCTSEDEQNRVSFDGHINPLPLVSEPQSHLSFALQADHRQTSTHIISFNLRIPPRILAFCGGGALCIAHIGVLKVLSKHGLLLSVNECVGVSAGAIISLLYVLGYTLDEMERLCLQLDFTSFAPSFQPDMLLSLYTSWGLDTGATAERFIRSLFTTKGLSPECSFADLYKKGIRFRCYATEIQTAKIKEFSYKETPTTQVAFAIRASISVPVIFTPLRDSSGHMYVDGGIIHNTPIAFLSQEEIKYSLGIHFDTSTSSIGDVSILEACKSLYTSITRLRNETLLKQYKDSIIYVPMFGEIPIRDSYSLEYKNSLLKLGERACNAFLKQRPPRRPRRFSAM